MEDGKIRQVAVRSVWDSILSRYTTWYKQLRQSVKAWLALVKHSPFDTKEFADMTRLNWQDPIKLSVAEKKILYFPLTTAAK